MSSARCQHCLHCNLVLVDPTILKAMFENISDEAVEKHKPSLGPSVVKENLARLGSSPAESSVESVVIETSGQWSKWYAADVDQTSNGHAYYSHHVLGQNGQFLAGTFSRKRWPIY